MNASFLWSLATELGAAIAEEIKWNLVREHRNLLLTRCDWTQLPDAPLTLDEKQAWSAYRQALRDIPENFASPDEVVFPETPA